MAARLPRPPEGGVMVEPMRTEPCACGGTISSVDLPAFIAAAVKAHNRQRTHREWRGRQEPPHLRVAA